MRENVLVVITDYFCFVLFFQIFRIPISGGEFHKPEEIRIQGGSEV